MAGTASQSPAEGQRIPYELEEILGMGSYGKVHRVRHPLTGDHVAMKQVILRRQEGETKEDAVKEKLQE